MGARVKFSPKSRTIALLESRDYMAADVELRQGPITRDLFGLFDVLAIPRKGPVLLVQCTDHTHVGAHVTKCIDNTATQRIAALCALVDRGVLCEVWGWAWCDPLPRVVQLLRDHNGGMMGVEQRATRTRL